MSYRTKPEPKGTGTMCTCWVEETHLRDIADTLTSDDYEAVLSTPTRDRSWQLRISGGCRVPDWQQEEYWIIECRPADDTDDSAGVWQYSYDSGEPIGATDDKPFVAYRIKARIHGIDEGLSADRRW